MMEKSQFITLIFLSIPGYLGLPAKYQTEENNLFRSKTSGKTSSILRDILNQESLVRFSMVQKIQNLVIDAIDNKNNTEIMKNKLVHLEKELNALETRDQRLEQENVKLQQELSVINGRIRDYQNITLENIQKLNESEIYLLKRQLQDLQNENEELKLGTSKIKEHVIVDVSTLRNEIFALKEQVATLSREKDAFEKRLHQMFEERFSNFTISVGVLDNISAEENATNTLFDFSDCPFPFDCYDIYICGIRKTGIYGIFPYIKVNNFTSVQVLCDMESSEGGWTVIQHRNRNNSPVNYNTTWDEYKRGFGDINGNYWLGNDAIHKLTTAYSNSLYIKLESTQKKSYEVQYSLFSISNETNGYRLSLGQKSGNIDDVFRTHTLVNLPFSTFDHDRNRCAALCGSGWWYNNCALVNLNAPFAGGHRDPVWFGVISSGSDLFISEMMIKRNH